MDDSSERIRLMQRLDDLEQRLARLEASAATIPLAVAPPAEPVGGLAMVSTQASEDELEFEVGRNWFAKVGIAVLTLGLGFSLTLPFQQLPAGLPSVAGSLAGVALYIVAGRVRALGLLADWLRGAALLLLWGSLLRLYFIGTAPVLSTATIMGQGLLAVFVAAGLTLAWKRHSAGLIGLALILGHATTLAVGVGGFVLPGLLALAGYAVFASRRAGWPGLALTGICLAPVTYFLWAAGNPLLGRPFHLAGGSVAGPLTLLALVAFLGAGLLPAREAREETGLANASALFNCALGYSAFLAHTFAGFRGELGFLQIAAFAMFLGLAALFWIRIQSHVATFLYAMTGYLALTVAIISWATAPGMFVWLSLQSVVVVATAVWFRSRFIVVANFLIYVAIVLAYLVTTEAESGISIGFGLVALLSARILHWQQARLELKTGLMRNAYLVAAFLVFPYSLYHLCPGRFVGLAWVGLALFYYALGVALKNQKFRWMGHATLLLTTVYVAVVGTSRFGPVLRVFSFLALGSVMLIVSLIFTRWRTGSKPP